MRAPGAQIGSWPRDGRRRVLALGAALSLAAAPSWARASVIQGDPVVVGAVIAGSLGGLASSIAAIVYAAQDRAFDDGWIVASLFSSSVTAAIAGSIAAGAAQDGITSGAVLGFLLMGSLSGWPAYWTIKTALADVPPPSDQPTTTNSVVPRTPEIPPSSSMGSGARISLPVMTLRF